MQKIFCKITFLDSYKNVFDKSTIRENVLTKNVVIRSSAKLTINSKYINVY